MSLELVDDHMCYVCGSDNDLGLRLRFEHPSPGLLRAKVVFSKHHQGFRGITHGGMVSMVLDEMMVNLAWKEGIPAVTAELSVRLLKPVKIGETVLLEGRIKPLEAGKRAFSASAEAKDAQGILLASATAVCVRIRPSGDQGSSSLGAVV